jgi:hypothetical protein
MNHEADEEPTQPNQRWHGSDQRQLYQALFDLQTKCFRLAAALAVGLPVDIEAAASELAAAWFDATAAIKAAHVGAGHSPDAEHTGILALRATHQVLFDLFELVPPLPEREAPQLRAVLCRLSSRIGHSLTALANEYAAAVPVIGGPVRSAAGPEPDAEPEPEPEPGPFATPSGLKPVFRRRHERRPIGHVFRSRRI